MKAFEDHARATAPSTFQSSIRNLFPDQGSWSRWSATCSHFAFRGAEMRGGGFCCSSDRFRTGGQGPRGDRSPRSLWEEALQKLCFGDGRLFRRFGARCSCGDTEVRHALCVCLLTPSSFHEILIYSMSQGASSGVAVRHACNETAFAETVCRRATCVESQERLSEEYWGVTEG